MALKDYLSQKYSGSESFLHEVIFPIFGEDNFESRYDTELIDSQLETIAATTGITSVKHVGCIDILADNIDIFDVTVSDHILMSRNRVGIQQLIRRIMNTYSGAFMIFHYNDRTKWDWRFSFCNKKGHAADDIEAKRYTFLLGPGQSCRTAAENFEKIAATRLSSGGEIRMTDIVKAFDVEALSDEFFDKYKYHYESFVQFITGKRFVKEGGKWVEKSLSVPNEEVYRQFNNDDKSVRDYVKKMMGRIVFLHFLQKKGWLGVLPDKEWGTGDPDFMYNLYEMATQEQKENFLDGVLESLFDGALNTDRRKQGDIYDTEVSGLPNQGKLRFPYLNGGLFEVDALDSTAVKFPKELFAELFKFLHEYNFTIDENDPNDAQVGIDPEMLGRIFENLLEDNKDKGAFYTPKEIVRYMCRESLIAYLRANLSDIPENVVRMFVQKQECNALTAEQKAVLLKKLKDVKICDPAIGSGAFPMELLRELFLCRSAVEDDVNPASLKQEIILNNIYGVDIEQGAVDIARLRFWLSLVVELDTPTTLPNLDYKIMQGNSLLENYNGIDLSKISDVEAANDDMVQTNLWGEVEAAQLELTFVERGVAEQLQNDIHNYFSVSNHSDKSEIKGRIDQAIRGHILRNIAYKKSHYDAIVNSLSTLEVLSSKQRKTLDEARSRIAELNEMGSAASTLPSQNPLFFMWHVWFHDVFNRSSDGDKNGFDILIGNPPYISAPAQVENRTLSKQREDIIACGTFETLYQKWDLYIPFMELGLKMLSSKGSFSMIVPYPVTNQLYGKIFREWVLREYNLSEIVDLNGTKVFENATVSNVILFAQNSESKAETIISHIDETKKISHAFVQSHEDLVQDEKTLVWNLSQEKRQGNRHPEMNVLGDFCYISVGMVLNADEKTAKGEFSKEDLISETKDEVHCREYIEAKDIERYAVNRVRYLEYNTDRVPDKVRRPTFRELYDRPKLIMNCLGGLNSSIDTNHSYLHNHSIYCAILWDSLSDVSNKSITSSIRKFSKMKREEMETLSKDVDLRYLLGVMNSAYAKVLLDDIRGGDYHIYPEHIRNIPIPTATPEQQQPIIDLVNKILEAKQCNPLADTSYLDVQIDNLVYALYASTL